MLSRPMIGNILEESDVIDQEIERFCAKWWNDTGCDFSETLVCLRNGIRFLIPWYRSPSLKNIVDPTGWISSRHERLELLIGKRIERILVMPEDDDQDASGVIVIEGNSCIVEVTCAPSGLGAAGLYVCGREYLLERNTLVDYWS